MLFKLIAGAGMLAAISFVMWVGVRVTKKFLLKDKA